LAQPYRRPAWAGLLPARPIYAPAPAGIATAISTALGVKGQVFALQNAGSSPTFRIDDDEPLFVKLVPAERWRALAEAEAIARWLAAQGAPAIAARDDQPPRLANGDYVVVYPFASGRPPGPAHDVRAVGEGVGRLHAALTRHPGLRDWQERTDQRMDMLAGIRAALASGEIAAGPRPEELRILAADRAISFLPGAHHSGPPRPLHGDLNVFNIVIDGGRARFIDFEDVVHSVLSAENDLALVCERVIMVQEQDDAAAAAAIDALLGAYADAGGDPINRTALAGVLAGLSLRSLCTLAMIDRSGHDAGEWNKFFTLIDAAQRRRSVFD
jgi:Ser/Thr protein kinase RdoA (MazF antagonist)